MADEAITGLYETLIDRLEKQEIALQHLQVVVAETSKEAKSKSQQIERLESVVSEVMTRLSEKDDQVEKLENELREVRKESDILQHGLVHPDEAISDRMKSEPHSLLHLQQHGGPEDVTHEEVRTTNGSNQQIDKRHHYNRGAASTVAFSVSIHDTINVQQHEVLVFGDELLDEGGVGIR
ncbi:uncharacterized protein LOC117336355 isoform X2 [Pecten maximus]|uniref:uncharacterized protein LOC117336355 isoform X1 n=1 Tax=Pecten maximus TaxID=6579 RepID=UPI0014583195|nr:uncharacterized protein LOC117336355 isoform X1 [Pecten maximus]XP_033752747.1 uncharacterized protein LOC117336355 isoform X2 [Pecten maximus]